MLAKGICIGRLFGVRVCLDWGLSILVLLIAVNLGGGLFPAWHPEWNPVASWALAFAAAFCFLVSIFVHEMSHALVGRLFGVPVHSVTLFIFGGAASMHEEPSSPRAELWMAGVGPFVSLLLGVGLTAAAMPGVSSAAESTGSVQEGLARLGPLTTLALWLGPTNVILGIFNLLPGFPLDGGRVLRAMLWAMTKNLQTATRWASAVGRGLAWLLILTGAAMVLGGEVPFLGSGLGSGLWLILIGWFLNSAATVSYRRLLVQEVLDRAPVQHLVKNDLAYVRHDLDVRAALEELAAQGNDRPMLVVQDNHLVGLLTRQQLERVPEARRHLTAVADVMSRGEAMPILSLDDGARGALHRLADGDVDQVPVVQDGRVVGLLGRREVVRWLEGQVGRAV